MDEYSEIQITCPSRDEAEKLGHLLLDRYLVACAQISGPILSLYRWKGKKESSEEWLLTVKTRRCLFDEVAELVRANHSYEVPQIVSILLDELNDDYKEWINDQIR